MTRRVAARELRPRAVAAGQEMPPPAAAGRCKVLLISLFHPELVRGGAQTVCHDVFQGLKLVEGMEPVLLAAIDSSYPALYKSGARITGFDLRPDEYLYLSAEYDYLWHKTSSALHVAAIEEFLLTVRPDVVHFHHFLAMGIDWVTLVRRVLPECRIVFTFHEFLGICHNDGHMIRTGDGSLCTHASPVRCHQCFPDLAPEHFLMRKMWFRRHLDCADLFTCPSRFMIDHYVAWGLPRDKIRHVGNGHMWYGQDGAAAAMVADEGQPRTRFGFFGQYVDVKGIGVILRAVALLREEGVTGFTVELNGDNLRYASDRLRAELGGFLAAEAALPMARRIVHDRGGYEPAQLAARMARVDWCVVPSVWWEAFGLVISEAWSFGKPVICSNVGGMRERVRHEVDGLHFEMGDAASLALVMKRALGEPGLWQRLRGNLPAAPSGEAMVAAYVGLYRETAP